jgi:FkbM family methyltransferase
MAAEHDVDRVVRDAFFADRKTGTIVEVGAARPDYLSISASFRELGWKVIAIEPNPDFCAAHRALGHVVLQYAASDTDADHQPFQVVDQANRPDYYGGNVSFESFSSLGVRGHYAELMETIVDQVSVRTISVNVRKIDTILAEHEPGIREFDILAVDVEGWELNVMRGMTRFTPKVVILENLADDPEYREYLLSRGYTLWQRLGPNDVYERS